MDSNDAGTPDGWLRRVYGIEDPHEIREYYDAWATSYDAELIDSGYASPARVAAALAEFASDLSLPMLDYGCGTGLSGEALRAAGFTVVDGADPAAEMLRAADSKGVYRELTLLDLDVPGTPFESQSYAGVAAIGLIGPGAGPIELFDELLDVVAPGGLFGVSLNDHAMSQPEYPAKVDQHVTSGAFRAVFEERGPHLPGLDVQSTVFVLQRAAER